MFRKKKYSAEEWAVKIDRGLTEEEKIEYDELCAVSPGVRDAVEAASDDFTFIREHVSELPFSTLHKSQSESRATWSPVSLMVGSVAMAACLLMVGIVGFKVLNVEEPTNSFVVQSDAEPKTQRLEDGSVLRLNSDTKLSIDFNGKNRQVHLLLGEAHFEVAKDPSRPFVVDIDQVQVKAVGTAFNIKREQATINVIVTEGKIEVSTQENLHGAKLAIIHQDERTTLGYLEIGQQAEIKYAEDSPRFDYQVGLVSEADLSQELQWRDPLLTFGGPTLKDLSEEFEQKTGMRLVLNTPDLDQIRIVGGKFSTADPYGVLELLRKNYGINWVQTDPYTIKLGVSPVAIETKP